MDLSTNFSDGGMLSIELAVSAHSVLTCIGSVSSLLSLLFDSVESLLKVILVSLKPFLLSVEEAGFAVQNAIRFAFCTVLRS